MIRTRQAIHRSGRLSSCVQDKVALVIRGRRGISAVRGLVLAEEVADVAVGDLVVDTGHVDGGVADRV